jgi:hypothetical protein
MTKKNDKTLARSTTAPESAPLAMLNPIESAPLANVPSDEVKADENKTVAKNIPDGYTHYTATDTVTGTVFATCQARSREYVSALVCDSPLGLIVARWSRDYKGLVREAKRILAGKGTAGLSDPRVVDVQTTEIAPENAIARQRARESEYYALLGMRGPNHDKREQAKIARAAAAQAAQGVQGVHGPVQQIE